MKTAKSFLITSFVFLLFTLLFTQSCSDESIPVNQIAEQENDRLCTTCWLIVYAHMNWEPVCNAKVEVKYNGYPYLEGVTDSYGLCSFYTEGLGLPGSPPDWLAIVEKVGYQIGGNQSFSWNGQSYMYVTVECFAWE